MPPVRCSGKTPAATSGFSQPADGRTDTSSGKSAVFSPRFSPFAAMPPATIVQPHGDRSPCATMPDLSPRTAIPPTKRFRPLSSQKTPISGSIAVRISPVRFGTCHSTCFIQQYFSSFFSLKHKMKKLIIASLALLLSACFPPPPHHGGGPGDNGGMHNPGGPGRGPGGGHR